jgi:hypothetical protein
MTTSLQQQQHSEELPDTIIRRNHNKINEATPQQQQNAQGNIMAQVAMKFAVAMSLMVVTFVMVATGPSSSSASNTQQHSFSSLDQAIVQQVRIQYFLFPFLCRFYF